MAAALFLLFGVQTTFATYGQPGTPPGTNCLGIGGDCDDDGEDDCTVDLNVTKKKDDPGGPCDGGDIITVKYTVVCGSCTKSGEFIRCGDSTSGFTVNCGGHTVEIRPGSGASQTWGKLEKDANCDDVEVDC